jgi:hypothetical protein
MLRLHDSAIQMPETAKFVALFFGACKEMRIVKFKTFSHLIGICAHRRTYPWGNAKHEGDR